MEMSVQLHILTAAHPE